MTDNLPTVRYIVENDVNDESIQYDLFTDAFDYAINTSNNNDAYYVIMEFVDGIDRDNINKVWGVANGEIDRINRDLKR